MPGFNHTGPKGQGPQTGRKMGKCRNTNSINDEQTAKIRPRRLRLQNGEENGNHSFGNGHRQRGHFGYN